MAYDTGNAPGSTDPRDLSDSSGDIDEWATSQTKLMHPDRLGVQRKTWHGMEQEFGDKLSDFTDQINEIVIAGGQIFDTEADGRAAVQDGQYFYSASASLSYAKTIWKRISASESERIADEPSAIGTFMSRSVVPNSTSLGEVVDPGFYFLSSDGDYPGLPPTADPTRSYYMSVYSISDSSRFRFQEILSNDIGDDGRRYTWLRRLDTNDPDATEGASAWIGDGDVYTNSVVSRQRGTIDVGESLNELTMPGTYFLFRDGGYAGYPEIGDESSAAFLEVLNYGSPDGSGSSRFVLQRLTEMDSYPRPVYIRRLDSNDPESTSEANAWQGATGSNFLGKTVVCLGDSITENGSYPSRLAERLGADVINGGFGGTRLSEMDNNLAGMCGVDVADAISSSDWTAMEAAAQTRFDETGDDNRSIVSELKAIDWTAVDYIIGFWGTNDWNNNVPLGSESDNNRTSIRGSVSYFMSNVLTAYPNISVMWVTPMFRARQSVGDALDSDNYPNSAGVYLRELGDAIYDQAQNKWNTTAFDLYRNSGINLSNYEFYLDSQNVDGLHPNEEHGYGHLTNKIGSAFESRF